jgi:hypothetical protein
MSAAVIVAHFEQRLAQHPGDVALLVLLGQGNGLIQVLLLDGAGELGRELAGLPLAPLDLHQLGQHDRQRIDRHDRHDDDDALGEHAHLAPKCGKIYAHLVVASLNGPGY